MAFPPQRALRHPVFLGALALLVVNDHLLKGSGLVPGWLTGKLSDFAGLVVAPIAVAALWSVGRSLFARPSDRSSRAHDGGTSRHTAVASVSLVAGTFALTELWQPAADAVAAVLGGLGVASRLWADPTDLVALSILPVTWSLLRPAAVSPETAPRTAPATVSRVALAIAVAACIATSPRPTSWATSAFLVNGTDLPVDVRVRWASLELACAELPARALSELVGDDVLTSGVTFRVEPGATIPLDDWAALAARGTVDSGFGAVRPPPGGAGCVIALLALDDAPDTLVSWSTGTVLSVPVRASEGTLPATGRVEVIALGESLSFEPSSDVRVEAFDPRVMPDRCVLAGEVGTSDPATFDGPAREVVSRTDGLDGCVRLDFEMGTRPAPFFVCAPADLVPFVVGDVVRVDATDERGLRRIALTGDGRTLVLLRARGADVASTSVIEGGVTLSIGEPDACGGDRIECGSFVAPHAPVISGAAAGEDPRGIVSRSSPTGRAMRIMVPRVESVIAASPLCAEGRGDAGPLLDAVVLYE